MSINKTKFTRLFYDKFAGAHDYPNKITRQITLDKLFGNDKYEHLTDDQALEKYKKLFPGFQPIPDLDKKFYKMHLFTKMDNGINTAYTVFEVNNKMIEDRISKSEPMPQEHFFDQLCVFHKTYEKKSINGSEYTDKSTGYIVNDSDIISSNVDKIIEKVMNCTGGENDKSIDDPDCLTTKLYMYQKKSINWMVQKEKNLKTIKFSTTEELMFGNSYYDTDNKKFSKLDTRKSLCFYGGALIDEVGLGKTLQMTVLAIENQPENTSYFQEDKTKFYSRATLIFCPNQLCGQWKRELKKMINNKFDPIIIPLLTKVHFDKYTYQDLLDADFVLISYTFMDNPAFLNKWMPTVSSSKTYHKSPPHLFDAAAVRTEFEKLGKIFLTDPISALQSKHPLLPIIKWHRVVVDEFHEIYTVSKYSYMINILPLIKAKYKWCVTGTPFEKKSDCLYHMVNFITDYTNVDGDKILKNKEIINHLSNDFFRRNTKKSISEEYKIPPVEEEIVWLKFTPTERMMYNAYLANPNNSKYSVYLRQLCCHPKLAEETKDALSNCKTLKDIENMMVQHYETVMNLSKDKVNNMNKRIKLIKKKIKKIEKKQLKKQNNKGNKKADTDSDSESCSDISDLDIDDLSNNTNQKPDKETSDEDEEEEENPKKKAVGKKVEKNKIAPKKEPVKKEKKNEDEMLALILAQLDGQTGTAPKSITLDNLKESLVTLEQKLKELNKDYEGKKTTYEFYKNVIDRIRKTVKTDTMPKQNDEDKNNKDSTGDSNVMDMLTSQISNDEEETCGICLDEISEEDIGVTKCGHIFCYKCIKTIITQKNQCPYCRKKITGNEVYMISYERKKKVEPKNVDPTAKDKDTLINDVGTKLANLILHLRKNDKHTIIFSQWDDLLRKVGKVLTENKIKNVFCRGNTYQRDKAIREFNDNDSVKVIMLSSESAASGTNLTKASQVILLDPVYGNYDFRKNTEKQAIGRAHRMGQKNIVKVLRFVIRDTIEEEITKLNAEEDKKHTSDVKVNEFDIQDFDLNSSTEQNEDSESDN